MKRKAQGVHIGRRFGSKNSITKLTNKEEVIKQRLSEKVPKCRIAEEIGVDRTTLWRWLKANGLYRT